MLRPRSSAPELFTERYVKECMVIRCRTHLLEESSMIATTPGFYENDLSQDERTAVQNGKQIVHLEDVDESEWPQVTVYQRSDASPEEIAAVFIDYPIHASIFRRNDGGITESSVVAQDAPTISDIEYVLTIPTVLGITCAPERCTTRNRLASIADGSFAVDWSKTRSGPRITDLRGAFRVAVLAAGSVISYMQRIVPNSPTCAPQFKKAFVREVKGVAQSLIAFVDRERADDPATLARQVQALHRALGQ